MYDDNSWYEEDIDIENGWISDGDTDDSGLWYNPPNREEIED